VAAAKAQFRDGVADIARRFGVTVKTLRVYEEMGLLAPVRDGNGWRTYGQAECERLHLIVLLRQLGFPLSAIANLLAKREHDLATVLGVQEQALTEQQRRTGDALALVRKAQNRLAAGETLDLDTLADLVRRTSSEALRWTPAMAELADRLFDAEQRERMIRYRAQPDVAADDAEWERIFEELPPLTARGDAGSPAALDLGRRSVALLRKMGGHDPQGWGAMRTFWDRATDDPALAGEVPMDRAQWAFFQVVIQNVFKEEQAK
jgi:MerR family transcriptional regulator, thiopeptide resistance regulator